MSKMTAVQKSEYMKNIRPKPITFDQVVPARSLSPEAVNQLRRPPVVRPQIRLLTIDAAKDREKANKVELIKRIKPSGK